MAKKKKEEPKYGQMPRGTEIKEIPRVEVPEIKLPDKVQTPAPAPTKQTQPELIRDDKGRVTGVSLPDGRTFLGVGAKEAMGMAESWLGKRQLPAGAIEAEAGAEARRKELELQERAKLAEQIGNIPGMTPERYAELIADLSAKEQRRQGLPGALREGTTQAVSRGITFGAAGFAGGALVGGVGAPVGAAAGAVAGVVSGYWTAIRGARKAEAKEDVANTMAEFTALKRGMTNVATLTTSNQMNPQEAVELFNAQYSRMLELEARLKYLTDSELKDYLSDGSDNLITVTTYLNQVVPAYKARIQTGLTNPNAATIPYSDVLSEGENNE